MADVLLDFSLEDQLLVNKFSVKHSKYKNLKSKLAKHQQLFETLDAAENELMFMEEETVVPVKLGEAFLDMDYNFASGVVEKRKTECQETLDALKNEMDGIFEELNDIKRQIYSKYTKEEFNLDFDP